MEYKGYKASISFDQASNLFYGEVVGITDIITFQGDSPEETYQAFKDSVNDYLLWNDLLKTQKTSIPFDKL